MDPEQTPKNFDTFHTIVSRICFVCPENKQPSPEKAGTFRKVFTKELLLRDPSLNDSNEIPKFVIFSTCLRHRSAYGIFVKLLSVNRLTILEALAELPQKIQSPKIPKD